MTKKSFEDKYTTVPESGCWLWTSAWAANGYGQGTDNVKAHRLSWELHRGPIPPGMFVCHKCDTRPCVNPDHLFLGTIQDNNADKLRKGRQFSGETHHSAKLTEQDAEAILQSGERTSVLAERYGVDRSAIVRLRSGKGWPKVKRDAAVPPPVPVIQKGERCIAAKLTDAQVREIKARFARGDSWRAIKPDYPVGRTTLCNIRDGISWAQVA